MSAIDVYKIGGSVLTDAAAYERVAQFLSSRVSQHPGTRTLAVVSAEHGATDALLATARGIVEAPHPATLDLLWSTGELRSAALLALRLQALGLRACAVNVHQTGLRAGDEPGAPTEMEPLRLHALLARHDVIVAPGFLARGSADAIVSLGRGGSDLTAVLLAAGLRASRCELIKDVAGYFSADPKQHADARALDTLTYREAITMADEGCELVQRQALVAARDHALPLVVRALDHSHHTLIH